MVVFMGTCPRCSGEFTWDELSQPLSCLEAKNVGVFGECRRGVNYESHNFDQDCPVCAEELDEDEGIDVFDPPVVDQATQGYQSSQGHQSSQGYPSKHTGKGKNKASDRHDDDHGSRKKKQKTS